MNRFTAALLIGSLTAAQQAPPLTERVAPLLRASRLGDAEKLARDELAALEAANRGDSLDAAAVIAILWDVLAKRGLAHADESRQWAERALAIRERLLGPDHADVATSLANLSTSVNENPSRARPLLERALAIQIKTLGRNSSEAATTLESLAVVYHRLHDEKGAIRAAEKALVIQESTRGLESVEVASVLNSVAVFYQNDGRLREARQANERALAIWTLRYGPDHFRVAAQLNNLSSVLRDEDDLEGALALQRQAMEIRLKTLGPNHPNVANGKHNIANLLLELHRFTEAQQLAEESLAVREKTFGPRHTAVAESLVVLAEARNGSGDHAGAVAAITRAAQIFREWRRLNLQTLSEREAEQFVSIPEAAFGREVEIAATIPADPALLRAIWNEVIASRALEFDEMASRRKWADTAGRESLVAARRRYAALLVKGPSADLESVREAMEKAERDLASRSLAFREELVRSRAGFTEVSAALPAGSALVAYSLRRQALDSMHYVAFVLRAGDDRPQLVSLASQTQVEASVSRWREELAREAHSAGRSQRHNEEEVRRFGADLRRLVWDPVAAVAGDVSRVFIVPDGALHLVNFAALPATGRSYLLEHGPLFHILNAEKDLAIGKSATPGRGLLALGNPAFARTPNALAPAVRFAPLPASGQEVKDVAALWPKHGDVRTLLWREASKDNLQRLAPGKQTIHLATHGFFLQTPQRRISGLALAGEHGILTAEEAGTLQLDGVQWVVLSGCDTGLGDVSNGEGVFGLRRAFQLAGARTVIMSLWPVDDYSARHWMQALYRARVQRHAGTAEAVRAAGLEMLRARRAAGQSTHPFYWAAFVAAGDWR